MIKDFIVLEIEANRVLRNKRAALDEIKSLRSKVGKEKEADEPNDAFITMWNSRIAECQAALSTYDKNRLELEKEKANKLKDLKATRALRYKEYEESQKDFFSMLKSLLSYERRKVEGRWAALLKESADQVEDNWSEDHKYADETVDKPLLIPERLEDEANEN
jgi:hypothetical protein